MEKTLLEKLQAAKESNEVDHVCFFNNGEVKQEEKKFAYRIKEANDSRSYAAIEDLFCSATESYARNYQFDTVDMGLLVGLIFKKEELNSNNEITAGSKPLDGIVRYYTGSVNSYLDGNQTNDIDYGHYGLGKQGYVNYNELVKLTKENGLTYNGPETFEEFKDKIISKEQFDITISADLNKKEEKQQPKQEPKKLSKRLFNRG